MPPTAAAEETRSRILQAAFEEFHRNGFQGGSLNNVVKQAGTTKGALFHHFDGKSALGYAIVEELLAETVKRVWTDPLSGSTDPIEDTKALLRGMRQEIENSPDNLCNGCPLNNLAQEMAPLDDGFRERIEAVFRGWRQCVAAAFTRGIECGTVRAGANPATVSAFYVAALEGIIGMGKSSQDLGVIDRAVEGLFDYLDSLKPEPA